MSQTLHPFFDGLIPGNNDMHLKNFPLYRPKDEYELTPAYDLLNVAIANPKDKEELALTLNGKKSRLKKLISFPQHQSLALKRRRLTR